MSQQTLLEQLQENQAAAHAGDERMQQVPDVWGAAGDQDSWKVGPAVQQCQADIN